MYKLKSDIMWSRTYYGGCLINILGGLAIVSDFEILSLMLEFATLIVIILTLKDKK